MIRSAHAMFWVVAALGTTGLALAQNAPPPPLPPPLAPPSDGSAPAPAPAPAPTPAPAPAATPAPPPPSPTPATAGAGAEASTSGSVELGAGAGASAAAAGDGSEADPNAEHARRMASLQEQNSLTGTTGVMRVVQASSGAPGTFRFSLHGGYFGTSGFLCNASTPCPVVTPGGDPDEDDSTDQVAMRLGLSATLTSFLEASFSLKNLATSNSRSRPRLLQVLGDTTLGLKGFMPVEPDQIFQFGGEFDLLFMNGSGAVGFDGGGTSFGLKALGTLALDNRVNLDDAIPLRFHTNVGWLFDNSAALVEDVENTPPPQGRGENIQRTERFGLDINRVDSFQIGLAAEYIHPFVRPFVEWTIDIPVNRQNYVCDENEAASHGELCLAKAQRFSTAPSRLTFGARAFPWVDHGLAILGAVDIGTGATSDFIDEVAPEAPYNIWFGLAWAVDTEPPPPVIQKVEAPPPPAPKPTPYVVGLVVDRATANPVPGAKVLFDGRPLSGFVTAEDGSFKTFILDPGNYTFTITAHGYRDGQCLVTVPSGPAKSVQPNPALPPDPALPGGTGTLGPGGEVLVNCPLDALPQVGNVQGSLVDAQSQGPVAGGHVKIRDPRGRELELVADSGGSFRFQNVPPGRVTIIADAPGFFSSTNDFSIKAFEDTPVRIQLNQRPEQPTVVVTGRELKLKKQIHFTHDSAEILPDSLAVLEEIADVLKTHTDIKSIEVQGHTDNDGTASHNLKLSEDRAQAVVDTLVKLGVDPLRLIAKGYGDTKPLMPNSTEANRAKNRRVQLMIKKE